MGSEFSSSKRFARENSEDSLSDMGIERTEYDNADSSFNCYSCGSTINDSSHSRGMVGGLFGEIIGSDNLRSFKSAATDWSSSQYETERHFYSDDVELENGHNKTKKPTPTGLFESSFDSSCGQLTPRVGEVEVHESNEEDNAATTTPSDEEISKIMYQQYVLQYHLSLYKFPSECEEFYDYYSE